MILELYQMAKLSSKISRARTDRLNGPEGTHRAGETGHRKRQKVIGGLTVHLPEFFVVEK